MAVFPKRGIRCAHPRIAKYLELCKRIQDFPRHLGQHSGGMVICQGQLDKVVPLECCFSNYVANFCANYLAHRLESEVPCQA